MPAIAIRHLSKTFEQKGNSVEALRDISLDIEEGDIYGIIGMSGAGKSTLVRCLNYLERPTSGEVIIGGRDLGTLTEKELREQRSDIAMIFQHFNLLMQKNVIDNICFPLQIQGVKKKEARAKARELLKTVGLEEKEKAYPAQLSGGQKQRVAIARALASNPKILLCDEATSALDVTVQKRVIDLLQNLQENKNLSYVFICHNLALVQQFCDRVIVMKDGRVVEEGIPDEVIRNPREEYTKMLVESVF